MPRDPECEDSLVRRSELPRTSDHTATINDDGKSSMCRVFLAQQLGGELAGTIVRPRPIERELLGHAGNAHPRHSGVTVLKLQPRRGLDEWQCPQGCKRVDPRGREKYDSPTALACVLEAVKRPPQVCVEYVAGRVPDTSMNARFGRGFNKHVKRPLQSLKIRSIAHIPVNKVCTLRK